MSRLDTDLIYREHIQADVDDAKEAARYPRRVWCEKCGNEVSEEGAYEEWREHWICDECLNGEGES